MLGQSRVTARLGRSWAVGRLGGVAVLALALAAWLGASGTSANGGAAQGPSPNEAGAAMTISTQGTIDQSNPFFQSLGTNGRSCASCHLLSQGMTFKPTGIQSLFQATQGLAPIFRLVDGANSPNADVSTFAARQAAYSMLLNRGTIRIGIGVPANAEFSLIAVDDPYHYASAAELSLFRRPLPATNLAFLGAVMWDGRETAAGLSMTQALENQARDAVLGHEQATTAPTSEQLQQIVQFEQALYSAQVLTNAAGSLQANGAKGGPNALTTQPFYLGINDSEGRNPTGAQFDPRAMLMYVAWESPSGQGAGSYAAARASVARGEEIFNTRPFTITGVSGLNDVLGQASVVGTCTTCHDTPNVGSHSLPTFMNTGVSAGSRRTPDLPLYTIRCDTNGAVTTTTDPGRALITGACADLGKFKVPSLRGLETRSPYFHDGSATELSDVIDFYNTRFSINFTAQEEADLTAFLESL